MSDIDELDGLSSKELHDKAVHSALKRLDLNFFFELISSIPAAEAVAGHEDEADEDIAHLSKRLQDAVHGDEGELAEALRPVYIEYLLKHRD
jgi:hypothetical protein